MSARNPAGEKLLVLRPQDFARPFLPGGLFTVTLDGISERGTTRFAWCHSWTGTSLQSRFVRGTKFLDICIKGVTSHFVHLEKFSLNFSSSSGVCNPC